MKFEEYIYIINKDIVLNMDESLLKKEHFQE